MEECIARLNLNDKQLILIGTIHMSKRSVSRSGYYRTECPDTVCVELDHLRYLALIEMDCKESAFFADDDFDLRLILPVRVHSFYSIHSSPSCKNALPESQPLARPRTDSGYQFQLEQAEHGLFWQIAIFRQPSDKYGPA